MGRAFPVFRLCLTYLCISFGRHLPLGWLWLSLAELPEGAIPSPYLFISDRFVHYMGRHLTLAWLSGSRSISFQWEPFLMCFRVFLMYFSIIWVATCPWAGSLTLAR